MSVATADRNAHTDLTDEPLRLGAKTLTSRLILGTGKYKSFESMQQCHKLSGTEMVTVALRRVPISGGEAPRRTIIDFIDLERITLLPNTAGAQTAREVSKLAAIAYSMEMRHLKVEVIGDTKTLLPDPIETVRSVEEIRQQFTSEDLFLMIYTNDDPMTASRLIDAGADCVMPAGSPIGSGRGIQTPDNIRLLLEVVNGRVPVILDAGIGAASDAVIAMELGVDAVLLNSAVARADNPEQMALAMCLACEAGRHSYLAGRISRKLYATASSPEPDV